MLRLMSTIAVAACVSALAVGIYEVTVRVPRTPRLAVVDIARLFSSAERQVKARVLAVPPMLQTPAAAGAAQLPSGLTEMKAMGELSEFGPTVERAMRELSSECACVLVAMAAVVGEHTGVADYTDVLARRLGITLANSGRAAR